jgi:hypothetical protein
MPVSGTGSGTELISSLGRLSEPDARSRSLSSFLGELLESEGFQNGLAF